MNSENLCSEFRNPLKLKICAGDFLLFFAQIIEKLLLQKLWNLIFERKIEIMCWLSFFRLHAPDVNQNIITLKSYIYTHMMLYKKLN